MKRRFLKRSLLLLLALSCLLLAACGKEKPVDFTTAPLEQEESQMTQPSETGEVDNLMPWEKEGAKHPAEYTLEEYEALKTALTGEIHSLKSQNEAAGQEIDSLKNTNKAAQEELDALNGSYNAAQQQRVAQAELDQVPVSGGQHCGADQNVLMSAMMAMIRVKT